MYSLAEIWQVLHGLTTLFPTYVYFFVSDIRLLMLSLCWFILVISSWVIFRKCILNRFENSDNDKYPILVHYLSKQLQIPINECAKGFILINMIAPTFAIMSKIAGILHI
jgi:hypothetical protein